MSGNNDKTALFGLLQSLGLSPALRNDARVLEALEKGEPVDSMHGMHETGLLDPFFDFLEESGIYSCIGKVSNLSYHRVMLPITLLLLTYMTKILVGVSSMNALPEVLFTKEPLMKILGFNAMVLENGLCKRGEHNRKKEPPKPFTPQMLANFVERFNYEEVESLFNSVIRALARFGAFPENIKAILDGSDLETTKNFKGCGMAKRQKEEKGKIVEKIVYGFKIVAVMDCHTQVPLAIKVLKINEHEANHTIDLLKQAMFNVKDYAKISWITFDRGFIDGITLHKIDQLGINFIVPAKKNMEIYREAKDLAGEGKSQTTKKVKAAALEGLTSLDSYCPEEYFKEKNKKDFIPKPINAVVVNEWENKTYGPDHGPVFLTNASVGKPVNIVNLYSNRSIIENLLFRETKQGWHLTSAPKKTEEAMVAHVMLTMTTYALTMIYRDWVEEGVVQDNSRYRSFDKGTRRWRREQEKNMDEYVIIFVGNSYAILHYAELAVITGGIRMKNYPEGMGSREEIYRRRGLKPPS